MKRYLSLRWKIVVAFGVLFGLLLVGTIFFYFNFVLSVARDNIARELVAVAQTTAQRINGDDFMALRQMASSPTTFTLVKDQPYFGLTDSRYKQEVDTL